MAELDKKEKTRRTNTLQKQLSDNFLDVQEVYSC